MTIQYPVAVGDHVTRVLQNGSGGQHVIFLHGVAARADRWRGSVEAFGEAGFNATAVDFPGHGLASKGAGTYTVPAFSEFVLQLMDSEGIERAALVGTSLGGQVASRVALGNPSRVAALVLVGSLGLVPLTPERQTAIGRRILDTSMNGIRGKLLNALASGSLVNEEIVLEDFRINNSPGARDVIDELCGYFEDGIQNDSVGNELKESRGQTPTLLIWGSEDNTVRVEEAQEWADEAPWARFVVLHGAGHTPYNEQPLAFNAECMDFVRTAFRAR